MISNCGHDENGRYSGGQAGDQTSTEWEIRSWYSRPWTVVLRHPDPDVRSVIADLASQAAENDLIGYNQADRYSYWRQLQASGYLPRNIKIPCNADCSSGVAANVKAAGYRLGRDELQRVSIYCYTGNLRAALKTAGFTELTDKKYLQGEDYLLEGDILLCEGHHVATNLTNGEKDFVWYETPITCGNEGLEVLEIINTRSGPGKCFKINGKLEAGSRIFPSGKTFLEGSPWFRIGDSWCSAKYAEGWIQEGNGRWWYVLAGYKYPANKILSIDGSEYVFDRDGWMITSDRISDNGNIIY